MEDKVGVNICVFRKFMTSCYFTLTESRANS